MQRASPPSIPYFVNFSSNSTGKHISATKRHITWSFGFAPLPLCGSGSECRGKEHEVKLLWSTASGKRHVLLDNSRTIHYSTAPGHLHLETKFEHSFSIGQHTIRIVARLYMNGGGMHKEDGGARKFDLLIDGQSVFDMLHIYELGEDIDECQMRYGDIIERFRYVGYPVIKDEEHNEAKNFSSSRTMTTVAESDNMTLGDSHYFEDYDAPRSKSLQEGEETLVQLAKQEPISRNYSQTKDSSDDVSTNTWELQNIPDFARTPLGSMDEGDNSQSRNTAASGAKSLLGEIATPAEEDLIDFSSPREIQQKTFHSQVQRPLMPYRRQSSSGFTSTINALSPTSAFTNLPFDVPPPPTIEQMTADFGSFSVSPPVPQPQQSMPSSHYQAQNTSLHHGVGSYNSGHYTNQYQYQHQSSYMPNAHISAPSTMHQQNSSFQFSASPSNNSLGSQHFHHGSRSEHYRR
mmetsp:Transcript_65849/g.77368  ORF Transcript_65849/g.77368 Transcript_65849/m.77368 type:complete len:462 (+) Transcript_65849:286-1671(+)